MKSIYLLSAVLLFSLRAQAPVPVPLAHGDVPGEPHHHLKIENAYVRAYFVEVPPHGETQLHQHDHDYIFVTLGASDVTSAALGKPEVHLQLKDGEVRFTRGGFAHVARNNSDAPFRNVTIEFLYPQRNIRNLCMKVVSGPSMECPQPEYHGNVSLLFETADVLAELHSFEPRSHMPEFDSKLGRLLVVYENSAFRVDTPNYQLPIDLQSGDIIWLPAGSSPMISNLKKQEMSRFLLLSFKDSQAPTPQ